SASPLTLRSPLLPYSTLFRSDLPQADAPRERRAYQGLFEARLCGPEARLVGVHGGLELLDLRFRHGARLEQLARAAELRAAVDEDRKSTRLNSSHVKISYAVL